MRQLILILSIFIAQTALCQETDVLILKAKTLYNQNKFDDAIVILNSLPLKNNFLLTKLSADCNYNLKDYGKALKFYKSADSLKEGSATFEISKCYAQLNKKTEAFAWLEKNLSGSNKRSEAEINTEKAFQNYVETPDWKKLWQKEWYSSSDMTKSTVNSYLKHNNESNALDVLDKSENKISPKHEYYALVAKTYKQMNLWEPALSAINKAIDFNKHTDEHFALRASIYNELHNYEQSINDYTKAIELNPYELSYYIGRANAYILNKDVASADKDIKIIENASPETEETMVLLAKLNASREEYLQAIKYYSKLIALNKAIPEYFIQRGDIEYTLERYQDADNDYNRALDINPNLPDVYLNKGKIYLYLLDNERACFFLGKAKDFGNKDASKLYIDNCAK